MPAVHRYSAGGREDTLTLYRGEVEEKVQGDFLGYDPSLNDGMFVKRIIRSNTWLDICAATVVTLHSEDVNPWRTPLARVCR